MKSFFTIILASVVASTLAFAPHTAFAPRTAVQTSATQSRGGALSMSTERTYIMVR